MVATAQNARIVQAQNTEIHRRRIVLNRTWDMQISYIKGNGFQATYYDCADPVLWSKCSMSGEIAAHQLDLMVNRMFGLKEHYVAIGNRIPVPITGYDNAVAFAARFNGSLISM